MNNCDVAAERAVLAGICRYGSDTFVEVADIINTNSFSIETNQIIYKCIEHILKEQSKGQVDLASIFSAANGLGLQKIFEKDDERKILRAILNFPIHKDNVRRLAIKLKKLEISRQLIEVVDEARNNLINVTGDEPIDQLVGLAENPVFEFSNALSETRTSGPQLIGSGSEAYIDYLGNNQRELVGISSGYKKYDNAIGGGFRRKTVNMIGARPKTGKTMLADNIGLHVSGIQQIPVLNLDTEMSKEDHWNRLLANISGVPIKTIETGKFKNNTIWLQKVNDAAKYLSNIPYHYLSIAGMPFEEVVAVMRRWIMKTVGFENSGEAKPCLIIYDYLKLMSTEGLSYNMQEYQLLGFQMTGLHNFMVRYSVPCLAFIQLNRDGITREDTDVASGSDRLIWLCSNFSIYKCKTPEEIAEEISIHKQNYNRKLIPIVTRHGGDMDMGDYINMKLTGSLGRITEGKTRNEVFNVKAQQTDGFHIDDKGQDDEDKF